MSARLPWFGVTALWLLFAPLASAGAAVDVSRLPTASTQVVVFARDIKPVLEKSCVPCHGPVRSKSHFRVDSRNTLLKGGESGHPGILPGNSAGSPLVHNVAGLVKEMEMPPLDKREKYPALTAAEIALIRGWIDQGANWPEGVTLNADSAATLAEKTADEITPRKTAPIFQQIRQGDLRAIARSLRDRSLLDLRDEDGNTPLLQAAFYLDAKQLSLFLDAGADPNATNNAGVTALMKAAWDLEKTRLLVRRHANINAASIDGNTALIIACYAYGAGPVANELIAHGADVRASNHADANAVMAAAEAGDVEVLRLLLEHGGDPNSTERIVESNERISALMIAAQLGHLDCVKLLLERGADVNLTTEHGNALHFAVFTERREVARLLLDRGAEVNTPGRRLQSFRNDTALTPLMYAAFNERDDPTIVDWLLARGANVNAKSSSGDTALGIARLRGQTKIVAALLAGGAKSQPDPPAPVRGALWTTEQVEKPDSSLMRKAAEAGVSLLLKSSARLTETTGNRCFTCHQHSQPALAWTLAREKGLNYPDAIAREELNAAIRVGQRRAASVIQEPTPVPSISAWFLVGLKATGYPADRLTDEWAYSLARYQYGDGRWITKASRAPTDYSDVTSTALALKALKAYAPPTMQARFDRQVAKGASWLRNYQAESTEERALQLLGLLWAGNKPSELTQLAKRLLDQQREDGGWAQLPTLGSDPYATGLSLYTLAQVGEINPSHPACQRGITFLLKNQCDDGSWFVRTRGSPVQVAIDDIFPHGKDQWISSVATTWSSMALMLASSSAGMQTRTP